MHFCSLFLLHHLLYIRIIVFFAVTFCTLISFPYRLYIYISIFSCLIVFLIHSFDDGKSTNSIIWSTSHFIYFCIKSCPCASAAQLLSNTEPLPVLQCQPILRNAFYLSECVNMVSQFPYSLIDIWIMHGFIFLLVRFIILTVYVMT